MTGINSYFRICFVLLILCFPYVEAACIAPSYPGDIDESGMVAPEDGERILANDSTEAINLWEQAARVLNESYELSKEVELTSPDKVVNAIRQALRNLRSSDKTEQFKASIFLLKAEDAYKKDSISYGMVKEFLPTIQKAMSGDSVGVSELPEIVVESDNIIATQDGISFIPNKKVKNSASTGYALLNMMNIPIINIDYSTGAIATLAGTPINFFIDYMPAGVQDIVAVAPSDVIRIEYNEHPSDVRFLGQRNVLNFVILKYSYGGYTKVNTQGSLVNTNKFDSYLKSKFTFKKTTHDMYVGYGYSNYDHGGENLLEQYNLDNNPFNVTQKIESFKRIQSEYALTYKQSYESDKFTFVNTIGIKQNFCPQNRILYKNDDGNLGIEELSSKSSHGNNLHFNYKGTGYIQFSNIWSAHIAPSFSYSSSKEYSNLFLDESMLSSYEIRDHVINPSIRIGTIYRFKPLQTLSFNAYYNFYRARVDYNSIDETGEVLSTQTTYIDASYSFQTRNFFIIPELGLNLFKERTNEISHINWYPRFRVSSQFVPSFHNIFMFEVNYNSLSNGIHEYSEIMMRESQYRWFMGNPKLNIFRNLNGGVTYLLRAKDNLTITFATGIDKWFNRSTPVFLPLDDIVGLVRIYKNSGDYLAAWGSANISWRLLNNALAFNLKASFTHEYSSGIHHLHNNIPAVKMNVNYYWNNFYYSCFYISPKKSLATFSCELTKLPSSYGISAGWANNNWNFEVSLNNFLRFRWSGESYRYSDPYYSLAATKINGAYRIGLTLSANYTISYGKKVSQKSEASIIEDVPSAINRY